MFSVVLLLPSMSKIKSSAENKLEKITPEFLPLFFLTPIPKYNSQSPTCSLYESEISI